jgi:hypothetical protein
MIARSLLLFAAACIVTTASASAQELPPPGDSRHSMLREAALGVLSDQPELAEHAVRRRCLELPIEPADDRLLGPHGDTLIDQHCEVVAFDTVAGTPPRWIVARYRWTSLFTAEDQARGADARDTVTEEETVLLEVGRAGQLRPVWHARLEVGDFAIWRSITPELTATSEGTTLLSVMSCVNGTGGCGQEFLQRHADGRWFPVWQDWLDQLPPSYGGRIRHGVRIDPTTLHGEAGFYGEHDANCCPSQQLLLDLALHGDHLVLRGQSVLPLVAR